MNRFAAALAFVFAPLAALAHDHATARYLGNEGVLIVHGETKVLFDAFYAESYGQYALVPDGVSDAMIEGAPPFDGIDAVFVSHVHGDHFSPGPTIEYLRAKERVVLFAPEQVRQAMLDSGVDAGDPIMTRVRAINLTPEDEGVEIGFDNLKIDVVSVPHAGDRPQIQNYAWRVTLGEGATVIHLGDADPNVANFSRHQAHFDRQETNTAFPPYWFVGHEDGELILSDIIRAKQAIGIHVPARAAGNGDAWRERAGGDLFTDPGETRTIWD